MKKRILSLFSGCGGMDLGFEGGFWVNRQCVDESTINSKELVYQGEDLVKLPYLDFETVFANDILKPAKIAWDNFFTGQRKKKTVYYTESIVDLVEQEKKLGNVFPKNIDVVIGGFPCQDFSLSGKRKGLNSLVSHNGTKLNYEEPSTHNRGNLYMWMKNVIEIVDPKMFVAENVKGLVNLSDVKEIIKKDFSDAGQKGFYVFEPRVLNAAQYGVPQSRERVFFIGLNKKYVRPEVLADLESGLIPVNLNPYPIPTHSKIKNGNKKAFVKLLDLFKNLEEPEESPDLSQQSYSKAKFMGKHCQGQTEIKLNGIGPTIRAEHHGNIEFRRLAKEHGGKYIEELENGKKERRLTVRECALIQTFPPDYRFVTKKNGSDTYLSASGAYKVIGNAVPPLLAYHLAKSISINWKKYFIS